MKNNTRDMTSGAPFGLIVGFMVPLTFGLLFQQLYNMVDTMVVGRFLGLNALAGVGSTGAINFLVLGFCIGICAGFVIPVAQKFGQKDYSGLRKYVANIGWLASAFAVVLTVLVCCFCDEILHLMNTKPDFFDEAYSYIFVIFLGIPAAILYNVVSGIIRSLGDSKTPLYFLMLSSVLNIVLDLISVCVLKMGVEGPALATVISQGVSGVLCLIYMLKKYDVLKMSKEEMEPNFFYMKHLCAMGFPMGIQYSITAIGSIVVQTVINGFGMVYVASVTAGNKVNQLLACPTESLGTTVATYTGQNVGAGKLDRIKQGNKVFFVIGIAYCVISLTILCLFGNSLVSLFVDTTDPAVYEKVLKGAWQYAFCSCASYFLLVVLHIYRFGMQGLGFSQFAVFAGVFEMAARFFVAFILAPKFGFIAVCFSSPIAWIAADLFLIPCYSYLFKTLQRLMNQSE